MREVDLDNRQHRQLVAKFLDMGQAEFKDNQDYKSLVSYISELNQLEDNYRAEMKNATDRSKGERKKLRKALRREINLDKRQGEFGKVVVPAAAAKEIAATPQFVPDVTPKAAVIDKRELADAQLAAIK